MRQLVAKFRKIERGRNLGVTQGEQKLLPFYPPRLFALHTLWCTTRDDPRDGHFNSDRQGDKICLSCWEGLSCKRCVKNWFGTGCSTYCVPRDSDELGHYK